MDEAVKTCFIKFWKKQYLMQCLYIFIPFYFYFFYFCMEVAHKLTIISIISSAAICFGSKTFSFYLVYLLPAHLTLNGTKWLVLAWKNFENDQKFLLLFLECEKKNTCGGRGSGYFEILRAAIIVQFQTFFHILRKWLILSDTFCRHILKFLSDTIYKLSEAVSEKGFSL